MTLPSQKSQPAPIRLTGSSSDVIITSPRSNATETINNYNAIQGAQWVQEPLFIQIGIEGDDM